MLQFYTFRYRPVSLIKLLSNGPVEVPEGHLFGSRLSTLDRAHHVIQIKLEVVDIKTGLAETRAIFLIFINGSVKQLEP